MLIRTFIVIIFSATAISVLVALLSGIWNSAFMGGGAAFAGALFGMGLFAWAMRERRDGSIMRRTNRIMGAFIAAMLFRVIILASALAALLLVFRWDPLVFVTAFIAVHIVSQIIEIRYVHKAGNMPGAFGTV